MTSQRIDLGHGITVEYFAWAPDRELNPNYAGIPDIPRFGLIIYHPRPDGTRECLSQLDFDSPERDRVRAAGSWPARPSWTVEQEEPLTLSPSIKCRACGIHGFIRNGQWVPA